MCTLIALHCCVPGLPLVVAANRDEYLERPSEGPRLRAGGAAGAFVSPLDVREGGTWLGVGRAGVFAGITNLRGAPRDPARRSRGLLVLDLLQAGSAAEAAAAVAALPAAAHNPFNLLVADAGSAFLASAADGPPRVQRLAAGVHVVGNVPPEAASVAKLARLRARAQRAAADGPGRVLDALAEVCRSHDGSDEPLDAACIHTPVYGTRSSTLLSLGGAREALLFAEGPPCLNPYADHSALLRELRSERAIAGAA